MTRVPRVLPCLLAAWLVAGRAGAQQQPLDPAGIARLVADGNGRIEVSTNRATGAACFVRPTRGQALELPNLASPALDADAQQLRTTAFFASYGSAFGITDASAQLELLRVEEDRLGATRLSYRQLHRGVPVFGGEIKVHFDASGQLRAVNGTFVPGITVDPVPGLPAGEAGKLAVARVRAQAGSSAPLAARATTLVVHREGLIRGVPGPSVLAWKVDVGDGLSVREHVFVDAQAARIVAQITGTCDGKFRRAYDATGAPVPGPNYPDSPFWVEGEAFPTTSAEADEMIRVSGETHDMFLSAFGRDSYDAAGAAMDALFNRGNGCPNASWSGTFASFCPGMLTDDVVAHEWAHAYTQYTDGLVYQDQPGALNEAMSDIWGETLDLINGRGTDTPGGPRTTGSCSAFTSIPMLTINAPPVIAGDYEATAAAFGPPLTAGGVTGDVVLVDDGVGAASPPPDGATTSVMDGCETPFANAAAVGGKVAMIYRGNCPFVVKAKNAQLNGAIGAIIVNHVAGGNVIRTMTGSDPTITIPSLQVTNADGETIRAQLGDDVNATLRLAPGADNSHRWLIFEDQTGDGRGAWRDMWNPPCYGDPGKMTDAEYSCSTGDHGGVHTNSGVPNHAYALMVDGGTYNGQTIAPIGLTKAAHVHWRAQTTYRVSTSGFADHADALDQSCADLIGVNLADLSTGAPSGQILSASDCDQVRAAALAVELRTPSTCPPPARPGWVPDGAARPGAPLLVVKAAPSPMLRLEWSASCSPTVADYAVHEGAIDTFYSHVPLNCSTATVTFETITPGLGGRYYLIVPLTSTDEGSYGLDSFGSERPPAGAGTCRATVDFDCP